MLLTAPILQIPAPSNHEEKRAAFCKAGWKDRARRACMWMTR